MTSQLTHWIVVHGLLAVFVLMALDAVVPAGGELVMLFAGALAAGAIAGHSGPSLAAVIATGTIGYLAGSLAGWGIGRAGGRAFIERRGRWLHIGTERFERAERWFDRFDDWAVPIGLATPLARSFVAIPAGIVRVSFRKFVALALVGSAAFCFGLGAAGWALGSAYTHAHRDLAYVEYAVVAGIVALAAYLLYRWGTVSRRRVADTAD